MAKGFKKSPFDRFNNIEPEQKSEPKRDNIVNGKPKKVGRPRIKQGEYKTINISVLVELLEKLKEVKQVYQGNLTLYINKLIERDIDKNYSKYLEIINNLKLFK